MTAETLLEYRNEGRDSVLGWRVFEDGRVEEFSGLESSVRDDGSVATRPVPARWRERRRLSAEELERLGDAIAAADSPPLRSHYAPEGGVSHPRRLTWRLGSGPDAKQVVVDGFPIVSVAALDRLLQQLLTIRDEGPQSTVWRVGGAGGGVVQRVVDGEATAVPGLSEVVSLLHTGPVHDGGDEPPGPAAVPLLEVAWRLGDSVTDRLAVYADGRSTIGPEGAPAEGQRYHPEELEALRAALARVDWPPRS